VLSELVANAVRYGHGLVDVQLRRGFGVVRIEVSDDSTEPFAQAVHPPEPPTSGRGLHIVAALADSWGVDYAGDHKTVWAQLRI
jgi:anti-sigma regulatory factor (Ser/Thr protein kinase)